MGTIATTSNGAPFIYPSVTLLDRSPVTGHLFCLVKSSTANQYDVYRSTNNGGTWSLFASLTRANIVELGPINVCRNGYLYVTYRNNESDKDRVHFQRLNVQTVTWGGEHLLTEWGNGGVAGAALTGFDLFPYVPKPGGVTYVVAAVAVQAGGNHGVNLYGAVIQPSGVTASTTGIFQGTRSWVTAGSGRITPSLDLQHDGSGKVGSGSHLWLAFGRSRLQLVKLARTSTGWSGPSSAVTIRSDLGADDYISGRWDGALFCMAVPNPSDPLTVALVERNSANSVTTTRTSPAHPAGNVRNCMLTYDRVSRATRIYAVGTSSSVLYFVDYVRTTGLWTSWGQVSATAILGTNADNYGVRRGSNGNAKHDVYTAHATPTPNTLVHTPQALSYAPDTPVWDDSLPTGQAHDVSTPLDLAWIFSDVDPSESQSAYAISRQIGAGAVQYFRASDATWQAAEVKNISVTPSRQLAAGWGVSTDAPHTYKVKVWDSLDLASAYSDALVVLPSGVVNPTITSPTEGQVLTGDSLTVTWTVAEQSAFRVVLKISTAVDYDSGWVAGTDLSHTIPRVLGDGFSYSVFVTTRNLKGLPSVEQQKNFSVDFNEPAQGTVVPTPMPTLGVVRVVATNPAPTGVQAAFASQEIWRRKIDPAAVTLYSQNFEDGASGTGWELIGTGAGTQRSNEQAHDGSWSFKVVPDGVAGTARASSPFITGIVPGELYFIEGWLRASLNTKPVGVLARWYTSGDVFISESQFPIVPIAGVWRHVTQTPIAPATAAKLRIGPAVHSTPAAGNIVYGDELRVSKANIDAGTRIATGLPSGATYDDYTAVSGQPYEYRALVRGANSTAIFGPWTA